MKQERYCKGIQKKEGVQGIKLKTQQSSFLIKPTLNKFLKGAEKYN